VHKKTFRQFNKFGIWENGILFRNGLRVGVVSVASYNSNCLFWVFTVLVDIGCGDATMIGQYVRWALVNLKELSLSLNLPALAIQD
jgi:hypothetical protein